MTPTDPDHEPTSETQPNRALRAGTSFLDRSRRRAIRQAWIRGFAIAAPLILISIGVLCWDRPVFTALTIEVEPDYAWVQMLPDAGNDEGDRIARAIVTRGDRCPSVRVDGRILQMHRRSSRVRASFPVLMCEREVAATSDARIGAAKLPVRPNNPDTVVVIGDTGCRIVNYERPQRCNDHTDWPFARVAQRVEEAIHGDTDRALMIHVGDFIYRESPCVDGNVDCDDSPFGDNWNTWREEFFDPARPMLLAAPWVILRGNHENCERAGAGWLFFFALPGQAFDGVCEDARAAYRLSIGRTPTDQRRSLLVLDTADEGNTYKTNEYCKIYLEQIEREIADRSINWIALHQPLWLSGGPKSSTERPAVCASGKTINALDSIRAVGAKLLDGAHVPVILSGDTHLFQVFKPRDRSTPVQLIAGMSGTTLDKLPAPETSEDRTDQSEISSYGVSGDVTSVRRYGFVIMNKGPSGWTVTLRDAEGRYVTGCGFSESDGRDATELLRVPCQPVH
jgi:hypothetical protein